MYALLPRAIMYRLRREAADEIIVNGNFFSWKRQPARRQRIRMIRSGSIPWLTVLAVILGLMPSLLPQRAAGACAGIGSTPVAAPPASVQADETGRSSGELSVRSRSKPGDCREGSPAISPRIAGTMTGPDIGAAIEAVRHHLETSSVDDAQLAAWDRLYALELTARGLSLALRESPSAATGDAGAGWNLRATRIATGGSVASVHPGPWRARANVAERGLAPGIAERVKARDGALDWEIVLSGRPARGGDFAIEAAVGAAGAAELVSSRSLRWAVGGGRHVRMGEMVVRDARGRELFRGLPAARGTSVRLEVPAGVLEGAAYPVVLDPTLSPEYPVSEPAAAAATQDQYAPRTAWSGTVWLVVWIDNRTGGSDIYGARLSADGALLDPAGLPICRAPATQWYPSVDWDGTDFVVAWEDARSAPRSIRAARVSETGTVLDPQGIPLAPGGGEQRAPAVSCGASGCLVVWSDERCGSPACSDLYGARFAGDGTVLDTPAIEISAAPGAQGAPSVSADASGYFVAWQDTRGGRSDIYGARVTNEGIVQDTDGIAIATAGLDQQAPSAAWDGEAHLVVWEDGRCGGLSCTDIYAARVDASGTVLDPGGIAVSTAVSAQNLPTAAWNGSEYFVVWADFRSGKDYDIYGSRVTSNGTVLDIGGVLVSGADGAQYAPCVARGQDGFLVAWEDDRCGGTSCADIYGARVGGNGAVLDGQDALLSGAAAAQFEPVVAFDGTNYLAVWEEDRDGGGDIHAARLTPGGTLLDPAGIVVSAAPGDQLSPAVAWNGAEYLVVWEDDRCGGGACSDLYGARMDRSGAVLDPAGIPISTADQAQWAPAVAWGGDAWLVVWLDTRAGQAAYAARVGPGGDVLDSGGIRLASFGLGQGVPAVAPNGRGWLVVTVDWGGMDYDVFGTRVSPAGGILAPGKFVISAASSDQSSPAVAWDGRNDFVVWEDYRSLQGYDIYGARVSPSGSVLDRFGIPISADWGDQFLPSVAWDGQRDLVVWEDSRQGSRSDVYAARVKRNGRVVPVRSSGIAIAASPADEGDPRVTAGPAGRAAIVYRGFSEAPDEQAPRAYVRFFDECALGGTYSSASCPFDLVSPPDGAPISPYSLPPTFWWGSGSLRLFRVEFSSDPGFSRIAATSTKSYTAVTSWVPTPGQWGAIRTLVPVGTPVYWRVSGRKPGLGRAVTSPHTYSFRITP